MRETLEGLQAIGLALKLDDFGTGYSSLSYLRAMHFNSLKIDQSFVAKMSTDADSHAIVDNVIRLAHSARYDRGRRSESRTKRRLRN